MIRLYLIETDNTDPYHNLAMEEYLLDTLPSNSVLLYLWQNEKCVVIGRNQSALSEVNIASLEGEDGHLVRRLSGGGAVFHDLGNLNFTFIMSNDLFDVQKQTDVILQAMHELGLPAEKNGRNDLTIDGRKFSGHAYYHAKKNSYHHGTIMLEVDPDALSRFLNVSEKKLASKQVKSVKSRVINLREIRKDLSIDEVKEALVKSFEIIYGAKPEWLREEELDQKEMEKRRERFASAEWKYDEEESYPLEKENRFLWGTVRLKYEVRDDVIEKIAIYTDSLDTEALKSLPGKLKGRRLSENLPSLAENEEQEDVIRLLKGKGEKDGI